MTNINPFVLAQVLLDDKVVRAIRKRLCQVLTNDEITTEEVTGVLRVVLGDFLVGEPAHSARSLVERPSVRSNELGSPGEPDENEEEPMSQTQEFRNVLDRSG